MTIGQPPLMRGLRSEEDVKAKIVIPGFNLIELRKVLIPFVPKEEQDRIADNIRRRKKLIKELRLQINEESSLIKREIDILVAD